MPLKVALPSLEVTAILVPSHRRPLISTRAMSSCRTDSVRRGATKISRRSVMTRTPSWPALIPAAMSRISSPSPSKSPRSPSRALVSAIARLLIPAASAPAWGSGFRSEEGDEVPPSRGLRAFRRARSCSRSARLSALSASASWLGSARQRPRSGRAAASTASRFSSDGDTRRRVPWSAAEPARHCGATPARRHRGSVRRVLCRLACAPGQCAWVDHAGYGLRSARAR